MLIYVDTYILAEISFTVHDVGGISYYSKLNPVMIGFSKRLMAWDYENNNATPALNA